MVAVIPDPFLYSITYSVGVCETEITTEVSAPNLTEAIRALTTSFVDQGFSIKVITAGGMND